MPRQSTVHVDSPEAVGRRLRGAREAAGLGQKALSFPGCSTAYVSRLEAGQRVPSLQVLRQLAARLGVSESWLAQGTESPGGDVPLLVALARLAVRLGQLEEAETLYGELERGAITARSLAIAAAGYGQIAHRRHQHAEAIELLERALELDSSYDDADALLTLGRAYLEIGSTESALALLRGLAAQADASGDPQQTVRISTLLAVALTAANAAPEATSLLSHTEHEENDLVNMARQYAQLAKMHSPKSSETAAGYTQKAHHLLDLDEHRHALARTQQLLATADIDANQPEHALARLDRSRLILGDDADTQDIAQLTLASARALALLGKVEEALNLAATASDTELPDLAHSYAALARALDQQGATDPATQIYETAIDQLHQDDTQFGRILTDYAELLERAGRTEEAFNAYKKAAAAHTHASERVQ